MLTTVCIRRGRYRGRSGTIPGTLEARAAGGITKALVRISGKPVLLSTSSLETAAQLELFTTVQNAKRPAAGARPTAVRIS